MKVITLEEHFAPIAVPGLNIPKGDPPLERGTNVGAAWLDDPSTGVDIGEKRIAHMDEDGVTVQVISTPFAQGFGADVAVDYCRKINDYLAEKIAAYPDRMKGFAALPTAVPEACADELERCVKELGFVGTLIGNRVNGGFLSEMQYDPILAKAEELNVPIFLHPGVPPKEIVDLCYSKGLPEKVVSSFKRFGYGWHVDPGIHFLNLILTGAFDRHPNLQIILGHWGELLPYYIDRFDDTLSAEFVGIKHDPSYYLKNNLYVTSSGIWTPECLEFCVKRLGVDRIVFSIDYPFANPKGKEKILEHPMLSMEEREMIAHGNAERLLHI